MKSFIARGKLKRLGLPIPGKPFGLLQEAAKYNKIENSGKESNLLSNRWEWFDPQKLTLNEYSSLPPYWRLLVRNMNQELWNTDYRYVHCPAPLTPRNLSTPVCGIFTVLNKDATPETVVPDDLAFIGNDFRFTLNTDKLLWRKNLSRIAKVKKKAKEKILK